MVIDKNLTLADAYKLLTLLWTNKTGNVTVFAFFATAEFHTLGFSWEVSKLVANTSVASSGNYTAPVTPPPRPWWDAVWNTIAGAFQFIWNAVVAVYTFFGSVAKWLADVFIGLTIGLATGNWTYFQNNVLSPLRKALDAFIQFIIDVTKASMNVLLSPLTSFISRALNALTSKVMFSIQRYFDPSPLGIAANVLHDLVVLDGIFLFVVALSAVFMILDQTPPLLFLKPSFSVFRNLVVYTLTPIVMIAIIGLSSPIPSGGGPTRVSDGVQVLSAQIPDEVQFATQLPYTFADLFITAAGLFVGGPFVRTAMAMGLSTIALMLDMLSVGKTPLQAFWIDLIALVVAVISLILAATDPAGPMIPLISMIAFSLSLISLSLSIKSLNQDVAKILGRPGG